MIHAAKFLEALYKDFSKGTIQYRKTKDSVELAKIVAVNKPDLFEDITLMLKGILDDYQKTIYLH